MFAIAVVIVAWAAGLTGLRSPDRSALLAALDERALDGIPRHLDHDEGQELQQAVTAALAAEPGDHELAAAAVRGSFPIVPRTTPVIFDSTPSIAVEVLPPFTLPWKLSADASIEASLDGSDWKHAIDLPLASGQTPIAIAKLFPRAARQGFHAVRLRAALRFKGTREFMPADDTRELPVVTYGISGTSAEGRRVAAILTSAARVNASDFDRTLPPVPLGTWLQTIARTPDAPPIDWVALWCEDLMGREDERPASICARTMVGSSPEGGHAEIWVKVATIDTSGPRPTWAVVTPALERVDLIANGSLSTADLAAVPGALRSRFEDWPHAALDLDPRAIAVSPAAPKPGEPVTIAVALRNSGTSDLLGALIDVTVGDAADGPALAHRQFIRSIPAGESVTVETDARFPRGYGVVSVLAMTGAHGMVPALISDQSHWSVVANRFVRPELAPPGFVTRMTAAIGTPR